MAEILVLVFMALALVYIQNHVENFMIDISLSFAVGATLLLAAYLMDFKVKYAEIKWKRRWISAGSSF